MQREKVGLDSERCARATRHAALRIEGTIRLGRLLAEDPQRTQRMAQQRCPWCFYCPTVAGAAITHQPCSLCGSDQAYPSTATALLCAPCAGAHQLCRQCGGDIDGDARREHFLQETAHA